MYIYISIYIIYIIYMFNWSIGIHSMLGCKAKQPPQGIKLQEKEEEKKVSINFSLEAI